MYNLFVFIFISLICLEINTMNAVISSSEVNSLEELNLSITEIDHLANEALQTFNVPGASISIVCDDQTLFSKGYGFCDLHKKIPVTASTLFCIASCTKAFTALAIVKLVDEGKIELDDPVQKYIPEFYLVDQERTTQLTIRDLLAHRTGIARHDPIWIFSEIPRSSVIEILKHLEPAYDLRQEFQYNNFMYSVAGIIIERVTGQEWEEFISQSLLKSLEMKHSTTSLRELECSSDFSFPHAEINGIITELPFRDTAPISPGGGIISNALDMGNWLKLHLGQGKFANDVIIQRQILEDTYKIHMPFSPLPNENEKMYYLGYGLGWVIGKYREYDLICHDGNIDGFSSEVAFLPKRRIGIVILTNSSNDGRYVISSIRNQLFDKILKKEDIDWISEAQKIQKKHKNALHEALVQFDAIDQFSFNQSLEAYVGCYFHPSYGNIELKIENHQLLATYGKKIIPLYFKSDTILTGQFSELLIYGINPTIDFKFSKDSSDTFYKIEIPFEGFRSSKPITFIRITSKPTI